MPLTSKLLENYDDMVISHPYFSTTVESVLSHVQLGSKGRILMVVGPTGVGKTTLIRYCVHELNEYIKKYPDCGYAPPVVLEALAPESGTFSWTSFYMRALSKLSEPGLYAKADLDENVHLLRQGKIPPQFKKLTPIKLRELFEQSIQVHRPIAVFIDEVQHLAKCAKQTRKTDNLDVVKSISNSSPTSYILAGTYEARQMMYFGGQLSRRVNIEHFQRYHNNKLDLQTFAQVFHSIINEYNIPVSTEVYKNLPFLYNHSLGCIGILSTWIRTAIEKGITKKSNKVTIELLRKSRLNNIQLSSILREIHSFEIEHNDELDFDPQEFLSIEYTKNKPKNNPAINKHKNKPFTRNPKRDELPQDLLR